MIVILGPTCTGKTKLGIHLAKKYGYEIISADSRQVYKTMDYGTGKLPYEKDIQIEKNDSYWVINNVKIYGYDIVEPDEQFSAYAFKDFYQQICEMSEKLMMVGGTGFYIDAALENVNLSEVPPNNELRIKLGKKSTEELYEILRCKNPHKARIIDSKNRNRIIRAMELIEANQEEEKFIINKTDLKTDSNLYVGLTSERSILYENSDKWVENIFPLLIVETNALISSGYKDCQPLKSFIYDQVLLYIAGKVKKDDVIQKIKYDMHHYIRRQLTWFRRNKNINWFDVNDSDMKQKVENLVELSLREVT